VKRLTFLLILATMPDEAFSWFVSFALTGFPDGLGGFRPDAREAIAAIRVEASKMTES
jgi:hypothetical protein